MSGLRAHFLFAAISPGKHRKFGQNRAKSAAKEAARELMAVRLDEIRSAAQRVAASHGLDVVDMEFAGPAKERTLRVYLEKNAEGRARLKAELASGVEGNFTISDQIRKTVSRLQSLPGSVSASGSFVDCGTYN